MPSSTKSAAAATCEHYRRFRAQTLGAAPVQYPEYADDPVGFVRDVLRQDLTPQQEQLLNALRAAPYRVLGKAGHNVGKSHASACAALWWHLTRAPTIIITTATKAEQVRDILWKEIRRLAPPHVRFTGPRSCRIQRAADDFAVGTTARDGVGFAGHHGASMLFIFDEAVGIEDQFWEVAETMFGGQGHAWLCLYNPTDTASRAYREEHADRPPEEGWTVVTLSCLEHPNIERELRGEPPAVPAAVRLRRLTQMLRDWSDPIRAEDAGPLDIFWPPDVPCGCSTVPHPNSPDCKNGAAEGALHENVAPPCPRCGGTGTIRHGGTWLRPGPIAECRLLGRWPSQSFYSVWGDRLWQSACDARLEWSVNEYPVIGCDVARQGDDNTAIHCRRGPCSYHHEEHNGWLGDQIVARLAELAREAGRAVAGGEWDRQPDAWRMLQAKRVAVVVDDTGGIGGVREFLAKQGYWAIPVNSSCRARQELEYDKVRSELWFAARDRAQAGELDLHRLPDRTRAALRIQAMAQMWKVDGGGRRSVLPKDQTKKDHGSSPDGMDALNLAYYPVSTAAPQVVEAEPRPVFARDRGHARRKLFGR